MFLEWWSEMVPSVADCRWVLRCIMSEKQAISVAEHVLAGATRRVDTLGGRAYARVRNFGGVAKW